MDDRDQSWLSEFLQRHGGIAGTVHRLNAPGELGLSASVNIPPPVVATVSRIPSGKGMAGLALERNDAVTTCNIQTDDTGQVRPGAKLVGAQAGVALPVPDDQGAVRAVVGIAYREERTLLESELAELRRDAGTLP